MNAQAAAETAAAAAAARGSRSEQQKLQQGVVQSYRVASDIGFPANKLVRKRWKEGQSADCQLQSPHGHGHHSGCKCRISVASSKKLARESVEVSHWGARTVAAVISPCPSEIQAKTRDALRNA